MSRYSQNYLSKGDKIFLLPLGDVAIVLKIHVTYFETDKGIFKFSDVRKKYFLTKNGFKLFKNLCSSRSSSEERDDSSELPEDINSIGQVSPSKAYPGGLVSGDE